ncbi:MAG: ComF family protein [Chitinophagaceae bacterium]|nr:ComF family protein [Chitinophagaceae bacterium]
MLKTVFDSVSHILFPQLCHGCGSDLVSKDHLLCLQCSEHLHETGFASLPGNPVEKTLWGRLPLQAAASQYYFSKDSLLQQLIHQFKYKNNRGLGIYFGKLMGAALASAWHQVLPDILIPLPLFPDKERKRGYNQAALLCQGMETMLNIPVVYGMVQRIRYTSTQTHKTRMERWQNVEGVFTASANHAVKDKHILLVDDVITTGATLEACGNAILEDIPGAKISIVTLAYAAL